jgi:hypothetical protein
MIIITVFILCTVLSIFLYFRENERLSASQNISTQINREYLPVNLKKDELENISDKYKRLQTRYETNLEILKTNEVKFSHYHLGVGTSDNTSYISISSGCNLEELEEILSNIKLDIKAMISKKTACVCHFDKDVQVNGKRTEAKKLFNREIKLRIRCLDNEFKSATAIVDWYNINRIIQRTKDVFAEINASGKTVKTTITHGYLSLKLKEFILGYEITQLKYDLKEEEREEKRLLREVEREELNIKKAAEKIIEERKIMEELVRKELEKLENSNECQKELFEIHKKQLEELKLKEQRAVSLAQITRAGFVYIISNTMSFGEGICKIGMTRRADPNDRVKELGDASVPSLFTVHAFAYTEDAPTLENYLHTQLTKQRVNLANKRKEFFYIEPERALDELKSYSGIFDIIDHDQKIHI